MSYSVEWSDDARNQLAATWLQHVAARQAITSAQNQIDRLLAADPLRNAVSAVEELYFSEVAPLRAQYEISDAGRLVTVVAVRWRP